MMYQCQLLRGRTAEERLFGACQSLLEVNQALHIDLAYTMFTGQVDQTWQLVQILTHGSEPERDSWLSGVLHLLHGNEGTHIAPYFVKGVYASHMSIGLSRSTVHREAILVEASINECLATFGIEQNTVGVEENIGASIFQIANHARQLFVQQRFTKPVEDDAVQYRKLVDDVAKMLKAQVSIFFA